MTLLSVENLSQDDWTFRGADTRYFSHRYHDYPARMIPQIVDRLLSQYASDGGVLFDPYCGSGTTMVEGLLHGLETKGTDLNPLARLLARAKATYVDTEALDVEIRKFLEYSMRPRTREYELPPWLDAERVGFWFKEEVVQELMSVYSFVDHIENREVELFFLVAFSETIRDCSNTRNGEFKLFRKPKEVLDVFHPDVFRTMIDKLGRNRTAYGEMLGFMGAKRNWRKSEVFDFDSVKAIPADAVPGESVDIVVTSPPYGDSHTTVAYGQYSRLSSEWLGFAEAARVDSMLMGGKRLRSIPSFPSASLDGALQKIASHDRNRALEIASFYADLQNSIHNVAHAVKLHGVVCYVVANRRVKGVDLPTDDAVTTFFAERGFEHLATHRREIPNKRMPLRNSPSNEPGATDSTMVREIIVVLRKRA
ncbi:MAG: DNA methyltransferase [bacterium]|nr:DNA methyltransferase [bacterium]